MRAGHQSLVGRGRRAAAPATISHRFGSRGNNTHGAPLCSAINKHLLTRETHWLFLQKLLFRMHLFSMHLFSMHLVSILKYFYE